MTTPPPHIEIYDLEPDGAYIIHHSAPDAHSDFKGIVMKTPVGNILPVADAVPLTTIQIGMITSIAQTFDITVSESLVQTLQKSFSAMFLGRGITQILGNLIPGIGNIINAATAASLTEYIGWSVAEKFDKERGKVMYAVDIESGEEGTFDESNIFLN